MEEEKSENPEKNPRSKARLELMHIWHRDGIELDRTGSTLMRGERSHLCAGNLCSFSHLVIHLGDITVSPKYYKITA